MLRAAHTSSELLLGTTIGTLRYPLNQLLAAAIDALLFFPDIAERVRNALEKLNPVFIIGNTTDIVFSTAKL